MATNAVRIEAATEKAEEASQVLFDFTTFGPTEDVTNQEAEVFPSLQKFLALAQTAIDNITAPVLASQAEAEAGIENSKTMTALRVAQAVTAQRRRLSAQATMTTLQSIPTAVRTRLDFNIIVRDDDGMITGQGSGAGGTWKCTVPVHGIYAISTTNRFNSVGTGNQRSTQIESNLQTIPGELSNELDADDISDLSFLGSQVIKNYVEVELVALEEINISGFQATPPSTAQNIGNGAAVGNVFTISLIHEL